MIFAIIINGSESTYIVGNILELQSDEDGNPICLLCDEKLTSEHNWLEHIELEKSKLIKNIASLKEYRASSDNLSLSPISEQCRRKREYELLRIRSNQQKRLALKNREYREASNSQSNCPTTMSQTVNDESGTKLKKEDCEMQISGNNNNFCRFCQRHHEYLIISSNFEHPRCHDCFLKLRAQTGVLPLSITSPPIDCCSPNGTTGKVSSPHSPLSLVVEQKRLRTE